MAEQAVLALCATCSHAKGEHEGDMACLATWESGEGKTKITHRCSCKEFWPMRDQREDGYRVVGYEVAFGGSQDLVLNRRVSSELWDSLLAGRTVELVVEATVRGKAFKERREKGMVLGLVALRKLKVERIRLDVDPRTGEMR